MKILIIILNFLLLIKVVVCWRSAGQQRQSLLFASFEIGGLFLRPPHRHRHLPSPGWRRRKRRWRRHCSSHDRLTWYHLRHLGSISYRRSQIRPSNYQNYYYSFTINFNFHWIIFNWVLFKFDVITRFFKITLKN